MVSALPSAVIGGAAAASTLSSFTGATGLASSGLTSGPLGFLLVGASTTGVNDYTYDCWKAVLHDVTPTPSQGKLLSEIMRDDRIATVEASTKNALGLPEIIVQNVWKEHFKFDYVVLSSGILALHAVEL